MATLNTAYASVTDTTALTITLASLATSSSLLVGRESTAVSNTTNLYLDALLSGQFTVGTSPTSGTRIEVWVYAPLKIASSTVTYPGVMDGTDSAETLTTASQKRLMKLAGTLHVDATTSDVAYSLLPVSVAGLFGGVLPTHWGCFVTHNTGSNLNSTAGNHWLHYLGIEATSA